MSYPNWMSQCTQIHQLPLKNICLPATHDSGTYALGNAMTPDPSPEFQSILSLCQNIADQISSIPGIGSYIPNPFQWLVGQITSPIRGVSATTSSSILQQLNDGIRGLDLRAYYDVDAQKFYTYHGLVGPALDDILSDILTFVQANQGEIINITVGHGLSSDKSSFPYADLWTSIANVLESYAYVPEYNGTQITNDFFNQTYAQIIAAGKSGCSTVILVDGNNNPASNSCAWPSSYSAPNNGDDNPVLAGYYTDTIDYDSMISTQSDQLGSAQGLPFALYLTLTPQPSDTVSIIAASLSSVVAAAAVTFPVIAGPLLTIAAGLKIYELTLDWTTIQGLCAELDENIPGLMATEFAQPAGSNTISLVYTDYYETTLLVPVCIAINSGTFSEINYLFGFNPNGGNYWFIQQLLVNGWMGAETDNGHWNNSYSIQFPYLGSDGLTYLFGFNPQGNNYWYIQQLLPGGKMGNETDNGNWKNSYNPIIPLTVAGESYIFGLNPANNYWFIQQMLPGGQMGDETDNGTWNNYYQVMCPLSIDGETYLFGFNLSNNYWFIQQILPGGKMGSETDNGSWKNDYPYQTSYQANKQTYLFGFNPNGGNYWFIQQILPGGKMGNETNNGHWKNPYQSLQAFLAPEAGSTSGGNPSVTHGVEAAV